MQIGLRIRQLREQQGRSRRDIERQTGFRCVSAIESGRETPSLVTVQKLAVVLNVPLYLFFLQHDVVPKKIVRGITRSVNPGLGRHEAQEIPTFIRNLHHLWMRMTN